MPELGELLLEQQWRRYAPDWASSTLAQKLEAFDLFCRECWTIRHPERGRIKFELREAQLETVEAWLGNRYTIVLKARQIACSLSTATG